MSLSLSSLPPELLLPILSPLPESSLVQCTRVSQQWNAFAIPLLYQRVVVHGWNRNAKIRAAALIHTLASRPDIARWVHHLEIRDFFRESEFSSSHGSEERTKVLAEAAIALEHCVNLVTCIWPRHGTLTAQMLLALSRLPKLERLEINAHSGSYEPTDLIRVRQIKALGLTMPDKAAVNVLPRWFESITEAGRGEDGADEGGLTSLTILCQSTNYIGTNMLTRLAPYLTKLDAFSLVGCAKADHIGVLSVLKGCSATLKTLSLESLSLNFDLPELAKAIELPRLESLTLTLPASPAPHEPFLEALLQLTSSAPLASLTLSLPATLAPPSTSLVLYNPAAASQAPAASSPSYPEFSTQFVRQLAAQHARTLRKVAISRLPTPLDALEMLTAYCPRLETLMVPVHEFDWPRLGQAISAELLPNLRVLHLSYPTSPRVHAYTRPELAPLTVLTELAESCSPKLEQIGQMTKVYQVVRKWDKETDTTKVKLERWTGPVFPEAFQVIRA